MGLRRNSSRRQARKDKRRAKREERRDNRKEKLQIAKERIQEKAEVVRERTQERIESAIDRAGNILENVKSRAGDAFENFKDLNVANIFDNVKDRLKRNIPPPPAPIPDFSDVLDQVDSDKIQKIIDKLETPIDPEIIAQTITDTILEEVDAIVQEEGQYLWREKDNESGIFSDVIETIDEGLAGESDALRGVSYEERTPVEPLPIPEPNDARHMLIQPEEKTGLQTYGKELYLPNTGEPYSGYWHTERIDGVMVAFTDPIRQKTQQRLELIPKSEELEILEQVDLTPNPLEIETVYEPPSSYETNDGEITLLIESGTEPYNVRWTRTDENGVVTELKEFENKLSLSNLPYGVYNAYVTDSSTKTEQLDLRTDLGTFPDFDNIDNLVDTILAKRSRYNLTTNGWEFSVGGIPYVGKYHLVEVPTDQIISEVDEDTTPTIIPDSAVRKVQEDLNEAVENLYDKIIGDSTKLDKFFKPNIEPVPIENVRITPLERGPRLPFGLGTLGGRRDRREERRTDREQRSDQRRGALGFGRRSGVFR